MERRVLEVGRNGSNGRRRRIELAEVEKRTGLEHGREAFDPRITPRSGIGRVQLRDATLENCGGGERLRFLSDVADRNTGAEQLGEQHVGQPRDRVHLADARVRRADHLERLSRAIGLTAELLDVAVDCPQQGVLFDE